MTYQLSAAKVASAIRSLIATRGPYSDAARIRPASFDALVERFRHELPSNFTEDDLIGKLGRFSSEHCEHFQTHEEARSAARKERIDLMTPKDVHLDRSTIAQMTALERLSFANSGSLPNRFRKAS